MPGSSTASHTPAAASTSRLKRPSSHGTHALPVVKHSAICQRWPVCCGSLSAAVKARRSHCRPQTIADGCLALMTGSPPPRLPPQSPKHLQTSPGCHSKGGKNKLCLVANSLSLSPSAGPVTSLGKEMPLPVSGPLGDPDPDMMMPPRTVSELEARPTLGEFFWKLRGERREISRCLMDSLRFWLLCLCLSLSVSALLAV